MTDRVFVDTNVLIYAHDLDAGLQHDQAVSIVSGLWEKGNGIISVQVLQEFYVNVTRKISVWKGTFVQSVRGQFHNEFDRSVSDPRRASSGIGKSRKPPTDARHYALFESEINKPNR